jgi:hypothetical protein
MSGTFQRQYFDDGAYAAALKQSTGPIQYILDPTSTNRCQPCRPGTPGMLGRVGVSITHQRPLVDVDSDLKLLQFPASQDPRKHYQPCCELCGIEKKSLTGPCKSCQGRAFNFPECETASDYTRLSNPMCTSREVGINRFQPLQLNPQDENRWLHPSEIGINYRMVVKDNFKPCGY